MAKSSTPSKRRTASDPSSDELATAIRRAGLRKTAPRMAVLRLVTTAAAPLSHGEIVESVGESFDRATVYRNLLDLVDAGLVSRRDLGDHVWRFELRRGDAGGHAVEHPHFLCDACGAVSCLVGVKVKLAPPRNVPRAVERRAFEVQLKGRCDACAE